MKPPPEVPENAPSALAPSRLMPWLVLCIFALCVMRGLRFPNLWTYTHFLFDYEFGFSRRALWGGFLSQFASPTLRSYGFFSALSFALLLANLALLADNLRRLVAFGDSLLTGCALVFASSMAVVMLAHTIGYNEQVGLLVALLTLRMPAFWPRLVFAWAGLTIALLLHEATLVLFFPCITFALALAMPREKPWVEYPALGVFCLYGVALALFLSRFILDAAQIEAMRIHLASLSQLPLRPDAIEVLGRTSFAQMKVMAAVWTSGIGWYLEYLKSLLVTWPVGVVLIVAAVVLLRRHGLGLPWKLMAVGACVSPLLLLTVAYDIHRFNAQAVTAAFLVLSACAGRLEQVDAPSGRWLGLPLWCVFLLFLNGMSSIYLFEDYQVRSFPFADVLKYLQDLASGLQPFPPIPRG
ncbi:hypothetical protein [Pseudomonas sp. PSE14]|uniref:hypothetical protein n=1 Tax=Pseudomonas sp. PSE14 TaxID=3016341 RepID=UPI0023D86928|nr:hypothetical protein [Pseudomonas sp. PSE14]WEJ72391.1 hypothetical protein O6P39_00435 [Pseudomonas sp. PSE14]